VLEGRIKLLGEDRGEGGVDALSHLDLRDCEGNFAVRIDADESIRREIRGRLRGKRGVEPGNGDAEDQPAARGCCRLQQSTTGEFRG
jgi:hypothetical protein